MVQRRAFHGTAAVQHDAEGGGLSGAGGDGRGGEAQGEVDGPGLIGEDGGVVEE